MQRDIQGTQPFPPATELIGNDIDIYLFQPNTFFYYMHFYQRLQMLENHINIVKEHLKNDPSGGKIKAIFVAPEYLFKDFACEGEYRYFTQNYKNEYIKRLSDLSKDTDLILAPGTICWCKISKVDRQYHYRNVIYFFHRGNVQKYKKTHPHINFDYDYISPPKFDFFQPARSILRKVNEFVNAGEPRTYDHRFNLFKSGTNDAVIKKINGLSIAIEICYDNIVKNLEYKLKTEPTNKKIDVHLIVADGVRNANLLAQNGVLTVKVERNPDSIFRNEIGVNVVGNAGGSEPVTNILTSRQVNSINQSLISYKFRRSRQEENLLYARSEPKPTAKEESNNNQTIYMRR